MSRSSLFMPERREGEEIVESEWPLGKRPSLTSKDAEERQDFDAERIADVGNARLVELPDLLSPVTTTHLCRRATAMTNGSAALRFPPASTSLGCAARISATTRWISASSRRNIAGLAAHHAYASSPSFFLQLA